jgi:hypothetical protein
MTKKMIKEKKMDILTSVIKGQIPSEKEIKNALYEMCDREHSSCNSDCLVYKLNGNQVPNLENTRCGCDCFKDSTKILEFIRSRI